MTVTEWFRDLFVSIFNLSDRGMGIPAGDAWKYIKQTETQFNEWKTELEKKEKLIYRYSQKKEEIQIARNIESLLENTKFHNLDYRNAWFNRKNVIKTWNDVKEQNARDVTINIYKLIDSAKPNHLNSLYEVVAEKLNSLAENSGGYGIETSMQPLVHDFISTVNRTIYVWKDNNTENNKNVFIFSVLLSSLYYFFIRIGTKSIEPNFSRNTIVSRYKILLKEVEKHGHFLFDFRTSTSNNQIYEWHRSTNGYNFDSLSAELTSEYFTINPKALEENQVYIPKAKEWDTCRDEIEANKTDIFAIADNITFNSNSEIVGIKASGAQQQSVRYSFYHTDYLTHRTMEEYAKAKKMGPLKENMFSGSKYAFRRTSLGVNVLVYLPGENAIYLGERASGNVSYDTGGKIYPPIVETIDNIHEDFNGSISGKESAIVRAIKRGMVEEAGITPYWYRNEDIHIMSSFYTYDYWQDNIFAIVCLRPNVNFYGIASAKTNAEDFRFEYNNKIIYEIKSTSDNSLYTEIVSFVICNSDNMIAQTEHCLYVFANWFESHSDPAM